MWKTFYFDGNQAFGVVDSPAEWERIKATYREFAKIGSCASPADLLTARNCPREIGLTPKFGFVIECDGPQTLGEFFAENGMDVGGL